MKTMFMKSAFRGLALVGALVLTAVGSLPAAAQSKPAIVDDPQAVSYSWGVIVSYDEGPQISYPLSEQASADIQRGIASLVRPMSDEEYQESLFKTSEFDND